MAFVGFGAHIALAQTNLETNAGVRFNFLAPGAANLALGGAFVALADDATAAYTNPAGLTRTLDPEIHLEARSWTYTHLFLDRGRFDGVEPTGRGLDTISGLRNGRTEDQVAGMAFLSYVYPHKKWAFALFRHELARFEANFKAQGAFLERRISAINIFGYPHPQDGRLASLRNRMTVNIVNHGLSVGYQLTPKLALGACLAYQDFLLTSTTSRFRPANTFEATDYSDDELSFVQDQFGEDSDWAATLGLLWESTSTNWSIGAVYRQGSEFNLVATSTAGPGVRPVDFVEPRQNAKFHVPRGYAFGISYKPTNALRISFEYDYIEYSTQARGIVDIFDIPRQPTGIGSVWGLGGPPTLELDRFDIEDANELHLGFEYAFYRLKTPVTIRLGAWHDPDHSLWYSGSNEVTQAVFPRRDDLLHYSAGVGFLWGRFRLDMAVDYSERVSTGSLSTVYQF